MCPSAPPRARGVLKAGSARGEFAHERSAPPPELVPFVEHFWAVRWDVVEPTLREVLPHPSVQLVLEAGRAEVAGVARGRFARTLEGKGCVVGVKFRPGGFRPLVTYPVSQITGRVLAAEQALGAWAGALGESLSPERRFADMVEPIATAFCARGIPRMRAAEDAGEIVERIRGDLGVRRVEDLARISGLRVRALQRLFGEYVGVSPKWVIRRYRIHEAIERVNQGGHIEWAVLAAELGYHDQAHFIRDFRALVGRTPAAYSRGG